MYNRIIAYFKHCNVPSHWWHSTSIVLLTLWWHCWWQMMTSVSWAPITVARHGSVAIHLGHSAASPNDVHPPTDSTMPPVSVRKSTAVKEWRLTAQATVLVSLCLVIWGYIYQEAGQGWVKLHEIKSVTLTITFRFRYSYTPNIFISITDTIAVTVTYALCRIHYLNISYTFDKNVVDCVFSSGNVCDMT